MPDLLTDDELREIREALGDQVPAIWMHRNAWAWLAALCDEVEEIWRERNMLVDRLQRASLGIAVTLDTGRVGHNGHPEVEGEPDCAGCWWETVERVLAILDGTDTDGS